MIYSSSGSRVLLFAGESAEFSTPVDTALNDQGMNCLKSGEYEKAETLFTDAIRINPGVKYYYNNLAVSQLKLKNYSAAYQSLRKAIGFDPQYVKALSNLAITCFYRSSYREALDYYLKARNADSAYVNQRFERSRVKRKVEELSRENPGNSDYKKILERIQREERSMIIQP